MAQMIDVAPEGWWAMASPDSFFPEDLPEDWQLTYYANAFSSAVVPAAHWTQRSAQALAGWRADVNPGFRFYLGQPQPADPDQLERAAAALDDALAAFVEPPSTSGQEAPTALLEPRSAGAQRRIGSALRCPSVLNRDLRGARDWLRARVNRAPGEHWLLILEQPTADELRRWRDLLVLMGLA